MGVTRLVEAGRGLALYAVAGDGVAVIEARHAAPIGVEVVVEHRAGDGDVADAVEIDDDLVVVRGVGVGVHGHHSAPGAVGHVSVRVAVDVQAGGVLAGDHYVADGEGAVVGGVEPVGPEVACPLQEGLGGPVEELAVPVGLTDDGVASVVGGPAPQGRLVGVGQPAGGGDAAVVGQQAQPCSDVAVADGLDGGALHRVALAAVAGQGGGPAGEERPGAAGGHGGVLGGVADEADGGAGAGRAGQ